MFILCRNRPHLGGKPCHGSATDTWNKKQNEHRACPPNEQQKKTMATYFAQWRGAPLLIVSADPAKTSIVAHPPSSNINVHSDSCIC